MMTVATPIFALDDCLITCGNCGYDLRGLIEPRCPECGTPFNADDVIDEADLLALIANAMTPWMRHMLHRVLFAAFVVVIVCLIGLIKTQKLAF